MTDSKSRVKYSTGTIVGDYKIINHIGSGGYGDIYTVCKKDAKDESNLAAMKVEYVDAQKKGLEEEIDFLLQLQGSPYFPRFITKGETSDCLYLVMELFGPSVSNMRRVCEERHFSVYSTLKIAAEMVKCIREFHAKGFVHRDIKPANFLIRPSRSMPICLIDFGLSKSYINHATGAHVPYSDDAGFTGTCRYASVHAHDNLELSRRDDMLSWFYSVIELAQGHVPWPGSKDRELTEGLKKKMSATELCKKLPDEFIDIYRGLRALKFEEEPPYDRILEKIDHAIERLCDKPYHYDWELLPPERIRDISNIPLDLPPPGTVEKPIIEEVKPDPVMESESESTKAGCCGCRI